MNLQQVIDNLKEEAAKYRSGAKRTIELRPTDTEDERAWEDMAGALEERATYFEQQLAAEQTSSAAQEAELKRALKREGPVDESSSE